LKRLVSNRASFAPTVGAVRNKKYFMLGIEDLVVYTARSFYGLRVAKKFRWYAS